MANFLDKNSAARLWNHMKEYVVKNRFSEARLEIDSETGHLIAQESGNLSFTVDNNGHLISEVI